MQTGRKCKQCKNKVISVKAACIMRFVVIASVTNNTQQTFKKITDPTISYHRFLTRKKRSKQALIIIPTCAAARAKMKRLMSSKTAVSTR